MRAIPVFVLGHRLTPLPFCCPMREGQNQPLHYLDLPATHYSTNGTNIINTNNTNNIKMGAKQVKMLRFLDNEEDREAINKAFATYDKDNSGSLTREEFISFSHDLVEYFIKKHPNQKVGDLAILKAQGEGDINVLSLSFINCVIIYLFIYLDIDKITNSSDLGTDQECRRRAQEEALWAVGQGHVPGSLRFFFSFFYLLKNIFGFDVGHTGD
jgi:hypothetical protein